MTITKGEAYDIYDYTYDNNGNMIYEIKNIVTDKTEETGGISVEETGGGYVKQYEYDKHNRLVKYRDDTTESTYEYTMDGLRKSKTVNGETTEYIWDRGNMIYDGISQYMYGPDGIETAWARGLQYYVKDIQGSIIYTANLVGNNINEYGYDSFGNKTEETKEYDDPFGYCGEYYDEETGNVYLRNRYYNPNTGRFITEDPAKDGLNWYVYCNNNPVMYSDPSGYIREPGYVNGVWSENPDAYEFGEYSNTYKALVDLGNGWSISDDYGKAIIEERANLIRDLARTGTPIAYGQETLIKQLHENADKAFQHQLSSLTLNSLSVYDDSHIWFVQMECSDWDYKYNDNLRVPYPYFRGEDMNKIMEDGSMPKNWTSWIYFDSVLISADQFSNINLGYVGKSMGYDGVLLLNPTTTGGGDDYWIQYGITMFETGR